MKYIMTFSILVHDPSTNSLAGAAATGSLCVGGWVLRGRVGIGMSASQGKAPSTFWGENVLERMRQGEGVGAAIYGVAEADPGRAQRQLCALNRNGEGSIFTGDDNTPEIGEKVFENGVAAGNMLAHAGVVDALVAGYRAAAGSLAQRLLAGLVAAERAGSDSRGLQSAALLVLSPAHAPLTLRVDYSQSPLDDLASLLVRTTTGAYAKWARQMPCADNPGAGYTP